jgi:hypothetical protein
MVKLNYMPKNKTESLLKGLKNIDVTTENPKGTKSLSRTTKLENEIEELVIPDWKP